MHKKLNKHYWSLLLPTSFVLLLCIILEPSWMTNDDAAMSMIAHGYGGIAEASPKLVYSNILWGKFVQLLPTISGIYGYSLATLLVISVSGTCLITLLLKNTDSLLLSCLIVTLVMIQTTLFPQFTITAGLVTVTAILMLIEYSNRPHFLWLSLAAAGIVVGYLIRREEAILICAIGLPFLPWRSLLTQARFLFATTITAALIISATVIDDKAYDSPEWNEFQTLLPSLISLVAFNAMPSLLENPELLNEHGYSENDIKLLERWLWFDKKIASADRLDALMSKLDRPMSLPVLGTQPVVNDWGTSIISSFAALLDKKILFMVLCSGLILLVKPSKSLILSWLIFSAALAIMGAIGRPGELRVYFPVIIFFIISPLINLTKPASLNKKAVIMAIATLTLLHFAVTIKASVEKQHISQKLRTRLINLPSDEIVAGYYSTFKANHIYSVTGAAKLANYYNNLYLFGWPALTPYSIAYVIERNGIGFKQRFMSSAGVWMLINDESLLEKYCLEQHGQLIHIIKPDINTGGAKRLSCTQNSFLED